MPQNSSIFAGEAIIALSSVGVADEDPEPVAGIRLDVTAMTMYLGVLLDVFDDRLYEDRVSAGQVGGPGDFATLARVRRYLGANPHAAIELLRSFCSTRHIQLERDV